MNGSRGGTGCLDPNGESQIAICNLRNTGMDPPPSGGRSVPPSVK